MRLCECENPPLAPLRSDGSSGSGYGYVEIRIELKCDACKLELDPANSASHYMAAARAVSVAVDAIDGCDGSNVGKTQLLSTR
jgi:hypothetical protein